jgi:tRNA (guanine-N7-)-methyltransferase
VKALDPRGLVITRKRKKWKFAHFDVWPNCFELNRQDPKNLKNNLSNYFEEQKLGDKPLVLELAAGSAEFSLELARRHPDKNFVAIDIKSDRLYTSAKKAQEGDIKNIVFVRMNLIELGEVFVDNSVDEIWITFPDPHPKKRSAKHRLTNKSFLRQYRNILKAKGEIKFKTDNTDLFNWSLEQFVADNWQIHELSFDLHESDLPDDYKIKTAYERKFTAKGIVTKFVAASIN